MHKCALIIVMCKLVGAVLCYFDIINFYSTAEIKATVQHLEVLKVLVGLSIDLF